MIEPHLLLKIPTHYIIVDKPTFIYNEKTYAVEAYTFDDMRQLINNLPRDTTIAIYSLKNSYSLNARREYKFMIRYADLGYHILRQQKPMLKKKLVFPEVLNTIMELDI